MIQPPSIGAADYQIGDNIKGRRQIRNIRGGRGHSGMGVVYIVDDIVHERTLAAKTGNLQIREALSSPVPGPPFRQVVARSLEYPSARFVSFQELERDLEYLSRRLGLTVPPAAGASAQLSRPADAQRNGALMKSIIRCRQPLTNSAIASSPPPNAAGYVYSTF